MKSYAYNKQSGEGRRLYQLLDTQFNQGSLERQDDPRTFSKETVEAVAACRINNIDLVFPSNLSGIQRPRIRVLADIESAWGEFAESIDSVDFRHDGQELPLSYTQPLEDDAIKLLIDAGLYHNETFEKLLRKIMKDDEFDANVTMDVTQLDVPVSDDSKTATAILVDPVHVLHTEHDPSEQTTLSDVVKRSAIVIIELAKQSDVNMQDIVNDKDDVDKEVYVTDEIEDVIAMAAQNEIEESVEHSFVESSELLDEEIDLTDEFKEGLSLTTTTEDEQIRELKERDRERVAYNEEAAASKEKPSERSKREYIQDDEAEDDGPDL